jgi:DNA-binding transcriptional ArsR family regulator
MDTREIARRLGSLSIEERVQIINSLLDVSPSGLQMIEIAGRTGLGAPAVHKQVDALVGAELVIAKSVDNDKVYFLETKVLRDLFEHMYYNFGPGFQPQQTPVESEAELE